jgi:hypothetical protein
MTCALRSRAIVSATLLSACALLYSPAARADVDRVDYGNGNDTMYFKDDPLHSGVGLPFGDNITVRPPAKRVMLIRPRTSFVTELLKSVEVM